MKLLILLSLFVTIFALCFFINIYLKKNIEAYGIYCGRYNINKSTAQARCNADKQCAWNNYTSQDGTSNGWCGQNPNPTYS